MGDWAYRCGGNQALLYVFAIILIIMNSVQFLLHGFEIVWFSLKWADCLIYRQVSILPLLSKVYVRAIFNQLSEYMQKFLNKILCGFRKSS